MAHAADTGRRRGRGALLHATTGSGKTARCGYVRSRDMTACVRRATAKDLDLRRLEAALRHMAAQRIEWVDLQVPSPFSLPLMVERFSEQIGTEKQQDRLQRILADTGRVLDAPVPGGRRRVDTQSAA